MRASRLAAAGAALGLMVAFGLLAAPPASADSVWLQAYERSSADAPCGPVADETPWQDSFEGQKEWTPSWALWANGGQGGWVCQRYIVWAKNASGPGCVVAQDNWLFSTGFDPRYYFVQFGNGFVLPQGTLAFADSACADLTDAPSSYLIVYAPTEAGAQALCDANLADAVAISSTASGGDPNVWYCEPRI